jgi:predicted NBD/HSP70 family sugar kinase
MFVGLDIGGTKTAVLVVDQDLTFQARHQAQTQTASPALFVEGITAAIEHALHLAGAGPGQLMAIGAGLPGRVIPETGAVQTAVNLNLDAFPFGPVLSAQFDVPVILENDVRTAALGTYDQLCAQENIKQLAYLSIGTGISAGFILHGCLYRGCAGMAGEIGHVSVIQKASQFLARAVQLLIMLYDVEQLVLGGGVARAGAAFLDPINAALAHIRAESHLAQEMLPQSKVMLLPPASDAPTWGAVKLAVQAIV